MTLSENIIIGIVTGILTSALIWLTISVFKKILVPWYQSIVYRGIDLDGDWSGEEIETGKDDSYPLRYEHNLTLNQKGHKISGNVIIRNIFKNEEFNSISEYNLIGEISDNCVLLSYQRKRRNKIGMGSYLFKITGSGDFLEGSCVFLNGSGGIDSTNDIILKRKNN